MALGLFAAAFYLLLAGAIWPASGRRSFPLFLLDQIGRSLLVGWAAVWVCAMLGLPDPLIPLVVLAAGSLAWQAFYVRGSVAFDTTNIGRLGFMLLVIVALISGELLLGGFGEIYRPVFQTNDALQSWNGWAIQLSENRYQPYSGAYPILWPGLWSLIYRAQGSADVWVIAKATLLIQPILLACVVAMFMERRRFVAGTAYLAFTGIFLWRHSFQAFIGDMDIPVSVMILIATGLVYLALDDDGDGVDTAVLTASTCAIFVGLASITKQAGIVTLLPFLALWLTGAVNRRHALPLLATAVLPLVSFLILYVFAGQSNPLGNLGYLQDLTREANSLANSLLVVKDMLPLPVLIAAIAAASLNLTSLRSNKGRIGAVLLLLSVAGAFAYANCCAYDPRNGWWAIALLCASGVFGLASFDKPLRRHLPYSSQAFPRAAVLALALAAIAVLGVAVQLLAVDDRLAAYQQRWQWKLVSPDLAYLLQSRSVSMPADALIITPTDNVFRWLPEIGDRFVICGRNTLECLETQLEAHPRAYVLINGGNPVINFSGSEQLLSASPLLGDIGGYQLYGPVSLPD